MIKNKPKKKEWELVALEAIKLAFNNNGDVRNDLDIETKNKAIELFYKAIDTLNPDLCWPFIKLADLVEDKKEKIKLNIRAYKAEENIYAMKFLFKQIVEDYPEILDKYLSQ
jgi:hypothetical protein